MEVLAKLKAGARDVSLSREKVSWGIKLPWDDSQTSYVWFDALINYYSATQFVEGKSDYWPADIHVLGKEILWFHTVLWQAMLLSAGIALPKKTFTHSFYTIDGQKMSKSLGNVISPQQLVETFGVDGARYLVATSFPALDDADVGMGKFKEKFNADLANNWGNLVSRIAKLAESLEITEEEPTAFDEAYEKALESLRFDEASKYIFEKYVDKANLVLNQTKPWTIPADDPKRKEILIECVKLIKVANYHLRPFMPTIAEKIDLCFGKKIMAIEGGLFPRIK